MYASWLKEWIDRFLVPIDDPGSRLFHLNLLMASALIIFWFYFIQKKYKKLDLPTIRRIFFRKKYWWNSSTKIDYQFYFLNSLLKVFLFIPFLDFSFRISKWTVNFLLNFNSRETMGIEATGFYIFLFSILSFAFDDFLRFIHHYFMHKIPFLWNLHKTHHSAKILTPITLYRSHPLESAMSAVRNSISSGVSIGAFIFFFESQFSVFTIFGINLFGFLFNLLGSNLRHSHIDLGFGYLENIFISPKQHQIHHSNLKEHYDKNFGVSLSIWDQLFGTFLKSNLFKRKLYFGVQSRRQTLKNNLGFH
jgi:sterol desaturase/sphingolipid hydroxylase (fatty acid hydroxylase superfamily)